MPRVSVVIAAYNHARYVRAAIDSVLGQSFQDFEIVVTDDGSSDGTSAAIQAIGDPRVSLTTFPRNYGACIALNDAIGRATGEYIAVLNSDDVFLSGKLERQVAFLDVNPEVAAVFGHPTFINENGLPYPQAQHKDTVLCGTENQSRHAWLRRFFLSGNALCHPTVMIRRRCYDEIGLYNPAFAQLPDLELWVRLCMRQEIHVIGEPLTGFRIFADQSNASAARPEVIVRDAWEQRKILDHYLALDDIEFRRVFPEAANGPASLPVAWRLGELALAVGRPAWVLFAFEAMYGALPVMEDESRYREFIAQTGKFDPMGMLSTLSGVRRLDVPTSKPAPKPPAKRMIFSMPTIRLGK